MAKRRNLVYFLLDRSGSMGSIRDATIEGFNGFREGQVNQKEYKTWWTLTLFDSQSIDLLYTTIKGKDVPELDQETFVPRGGTPLWDAIGKTVLEADKVVDKFDGVIFVIMTDGLENASQEFSHKQVYNMVREREDKGWQFIYLGANQDAYQTGYDFGMRTGVTVSYKADAAGVDAAIAHSTATVQAYASSGLQVAAHYDTAAEDEDGPQTMA